MNGVVAKRIDLLKHRDTITHTPIGISRNEGQCIGRRLDRFVLANMAQMIRQLVTGQPGERQPLASRLDGNRYFLNMGGCEYKHGHCRRFFDCFEQCVECTSTKHMGFINNVNFIPTFNWAKHSLLVNRTNIIDTGVRSGINFNHINAMTLGYFFTNVTRQARRSGHTTPAVQGFCQYACHRGFSSSTWTRKDVGMCQPMMGNGIL